MNRPFRRLSTVLYMGVAIAIGPGVEAESGMAADGRDRERIEVADVLSRIHRVGQMGPDNARLWRASLEAMEHPFAILEMALFDVYGPQSVREPGRGLERLQWLEQQHGRALTPDARQLLNLLEDHIGEQLLLKERLELLYRDLEYERQAHQETREKLESLRQIDRQLQSQQDSGPVGRAQARKEPE
jgi:hypothetical protein